MAKAEAAAATLQLQLERSSSQAALEEHERNSAPPDGDFPMTAVPPESL